MLSRRKHLLRLRPSRRVVLQALPQHGLQILDDALGEGFNGLEKEECIRKDEAAAENSAVHLVVIFFNLVQEGRSLRRQNQVLRRGTNSVTNGTQENAGQNKK